MEDLLEEARLLAVERTDVGTATRNAYENDVRRLMADTVVINSVASHYRMRAAWVWWNRVRLGELLVRLEQCEGADRAATMDGIRDSVAALRACPPMGNVSADGRSAGQPKSNKNTHWARRGARSKRHRLGGMGRGWRRTFLAGLTHLEPDEFNALAILALTGCRPAELSVGLDVTVNPAKGAFVVRIRGAKVTQVNGQPERKLAFALGDGLADLLRLPDAAGPYCLRIAMTPARLAHLMVLGNRAKSGSGTVRVSPIAFRHQFSADLKSAGYSKVEIARALGHRSDRTQQIYGRAAHGGGQRSVLAIQATHPVREHVEREVALDLMASRHIVHVHTRVTEEAHG